MPAAVGLGLHKGEFSVYILSPKRNKTREVIAVAPLYPKKGDHHSQVNGLSSIRIALRKLRENGFTKTLFRTNSLVKFTVGEFHIVNAQEMVKCATEFEDKKIFDILSLSGKTLSSQVFSPGFYFLKNETSKPERVNPSEKRYGNISQGLARKFETSTFWEK